MIRNMIRYAAALAAAVGLGACELEVTNPNDPEAERVLATPADAEALIGSYYRRWHDGLYRTLGSFHGMANMMSFQNYSSLANNCQNARTPFSGAANENKPGNVCAGEQQRVYFVQNEVARVATDFINRLDGELDLGTEVRNARARSFAEFLRGVSLGYVALFYDSSAVISPAMSTEAEDCLPGPTGVCAGALRGYQEVMDSALVALQRSIDLAAEAGDGGDGFPLPSNWIPSPTSFTSAEFVRLVRSYRARLRANVGRNPTERDEVDWGAVILDSQNGITADHLNTTSTVSGPFYTWLSQYDGYGLWHQMPPFIIGMADVAGNYAGWIGQPVLQRGQGNASFFMVTPDLRFPQGATRAAQQAEFSINDCDDAATRCERYFANRTGADQFAGSTFGHSNYDFVRFHSWRVSGDAGAGTNGNVPFFTKAELDMLEAEGHIQNGNFAAAAALINKTRTAGMSGTPPVARGGGLPAITADPNALVPGGADCVPKVPSGPTGPIACGDMMEALKWEKRIETAYTHFAAWYLDSRGWGDLAENTPLFWATPFQDLLARVKPTYGAGPGVGTAPGSAAPRSGYGW